LLAAVAVLLMLSQACSCKNDEFKNSYYNTRWKSLPIPLNIETGFQQEVVDFYNSLFPGVAFFIVSNAAGAVDVSEHLFDDYSGVDGFSKVIFDDDGFIESGSVLLSSKYYNNSISRKIFAHELMHVLGYGHHDESGLMNPKITLGIYLEDLFGDSLRQWLIDNYELAI